jgi:Cd2+/Zn2+-exporting ATPase
MTSGTAAEGLVRDRYRVASGCLDCAGDVAGLLDSLPGARQIEVLGAAGIVVIGHDGAVTPELVARQAAQLGLELSPAARPAPAGRGGRWWLSARMLLLTAAEVLLVAGLAASHLAHQQTAAAVLYLATVTVGGIYPLRSAWQVLSRRRLSIGTLLVAGTIGALVLGAVSEAAMLVVVFSLGGVMEDYVADRARGSIRALMSLTPPAATRLLPDGATAQVPVEELAPGDLVLVRPGERLPVDGQVSQGASWIDQSPVTGESIPAEVTAGSQVFGGTLNGPGALTIQVTKPYQDTVLARVIAQVEQAQASRGTAQRFADKFGAIYTPVMFALAAATAAAGPALGGLTIREAVYRGLVILVVSCSCALVISVPTAVIAGISRGARDGILIKGGIHLETLARVRTVAIDKTGTLTAGQPVLTGLIPLDGHDPDRVLALAAAVEAASEHPLAAAVVAAATERGLDVSPAAGAQATPGTGMRGTADGHLVFAGRPDASVLRGPAREQLAGLQEAGKTVVLVSIDGRPAALLGIADQLRPDAAAAVAALGRLGISRVVMLTGDNPATAAAIASAAGITEWRAGLLPEDKTTEVAALREAAGPVAMAGDGINDAPALATADAGIAMGAAAADIALETADIALMGGQLAALPAAITLARNTARIIAQNITLSLAAIAALDAAALTGHMSLAAGLLLNEGSAIVIIANGLRLLRRPARQYAGGRGTTAGPGEDRATPGAAPAASTGPVSACCEPAGRAGGGQQLADDTGRR